MLHAQCPGNAEPFSLPHTKQRSSPTGAAMTSSSLTACISNMHTPPSVIPSVIVIRLRPGCVSVYMCRVVQQHIRLQHGSGGSRLWASSAGAGPRNPALVGLPAAVGSMQWGHCSSGVPQAQQDWLRLCIQVCCYLTCCAVRRSCSFCVVMVQGCGIHTADATTCLLFGPLEIGYMFNAFMKSSSVWVEGFLRM